MKLNAIFTSNMVFAAFQPIRIYGTGEGSAKINFAGIEKTIESNSENWMVELPAMEYGGPYDLVFESDEKITLSDIYVGEVYLFAGQSNMEFMLKSARLGSTFYETNDKLRMFSPDKLEDNAYFYAKDGWVKCHEDTVGEWTAIGFLTASAISKSKNIAIGVICCAQGASIIESWVPQGAFEKEGINLSIEQKHIDHINPDFRKWNQDGALYDYALSQVLPFSLTGFVWYQGESDTNIDEARLYKDELLILINQWRNDFKNPELPFVVIQIADFQIRNDEAWKTVQQAQLEIEKVTSNVKTVISADVCEDNEIHPPTKHLLAERVVSALSELID